MKSTRIRNSIFYLVIITVLILLGFFRDYFLSQYNNYLYQLYYHDLDYQIADNYNFLKKFTYMQLYNAKFFVIAAFCLIYFFISIITINFTFKSRKYMWTCTSFYLVILSVALIFYLYGMLLGGAEKMYEISRTFLSLLQSPLILMILIPAIKISLQHKIKTE